MRVALVRGGVVDSVAVVGEGFTHPQDLSAVELQEGQDPAVGDHYDGIAFSAGAGAQDSPLAALLAQLGASDGEQQRRLDDLTAMVLGM